MAAGVLPLNAKEEPAESAAPEFTLMICFAPLLNDVSQPALLGEPEDHPIPQVFLNSSNVFKLFD